MIYIWSGVLTGKYGDKCFIVPKIFTCGINFCIDMSSKGQFGVQNETQVFVLTLLSYFVIIKVEFKVIFLFTLTRKD